MPLELTFLGSGTSAGVPMIGCDCPVCQSNDPRDRRTRPSVLLRYPDPTLVDEAFHANFNPEQRGVRQVLIDASPDLRQQAMRLNLSRLDAVVLTHAHADHIFGLDDLRRFNAVMKAPIDLYAEPDVHETLQRMFRYIFKPHTNVNQSFVAHLSAAAVEVDRPFDLFGATWTPLRLMHGRLPILGFRVDVADASLAYCTDVSTVPPESMHQLKNLDVLVIDALRYRHHPTHMSIEQATQVVEQLQPKRAFFTHLAHDVSHAALAAELPARIQPAYDGLRVTTLGQPVED